MKSAINFRIDKELKEKLIKMSKKDNRNLSNFLIIIIKKFLGIVNE